MSPIKCINENEDSNSTVEPFESGVLERDDSFDINQFNCTSEEVSATHDSVDVRKISDDDFLKLFPDIDINKNTRNSTQSRLQYTKPKTIADYAIETSSQTSSDASSTTSEEPVIQNTYSLKRSLNDTEYDENSVEQNLKRFKLEHKETNNFSNKENIFNENAIRSHFLAILEKRKNDQLMIDNCLHNAYLEEDENESENEDIENNNTLNFDTSFPNLEEGINFDVSAILKKPQSNFSIRSFGNKQLQDYYREKNLTTECIEQLYNSLTKIPKDVIENDPNGLTVPLMLHQRHSLTWMKWRESQNPSGGILADDMGLGKTLQMISLVLAAENEKKKNYMISNIADNSEDSNSKIADNIEDSNSKTADDSEDESNDSWGIQHLRKKYEGKTLVVCIASLIKQWEREVITKCEEDKLSVYVYHGTKRIISQKQLSKFDIVITTYHLIMQEYELYVAPKKNKDSRIYKINWERIILDEAHYIRNYKNKISKSVCELQGKSRWALTGTPIQNKESDLYALLKFLKCSPFDEIRVWNRWVNNRNSAGNERLVVITKSLMLRRTKEELMSKGIIPNLPDKKVDLIYIDLDPEEKVAYQKLLLYSQSFFYEFLRQSKDKEHMKEFGCYSRTSLIAQEVPDKLSKLLKVLMKHHTQIEAHYILVLILRLRQMCCHPALIKSMLDKEDIEAEGKDLPAQQLNAEMIDELNKYISDDEDDDDDDDYKIDEKTVKNIMSKTNPLFKNDRKSSKVRAVLKIIQNILDKDEKVIVVSQWTGFLNVIANHLETMKDANYAMYSGKVAIRDRQEIVDKLNDSNDSLNVLLLSLTAGGVGLNLIGANNLLLIDLHWNPQLEAQSRDRIYRFGQENNVHIYKFICKNTIEEKIKRLQDEKLEIAKNILTGTISNKLTMEDLKLLFS